jgi:penicillin-binding protein 1A
MVRIDRVSGKQVMGAEPGDDPKAAIIWEAFKPDTEPKRYTAQDEFTRKRDALIAEIRGAQVDRTKAARPEAAGEPADFVEEQGGLY